MRLSEIFVTLKLAEVLSERFSDNAKAVYNIKKVLEDNYASYRGIGSYTGDYRECCTLHESQLEYDPVVAKLVSTCTYILSSLRN